MPFIQTFLPRGRDQSTVHPKLPNLQPNVSHLSNPTLKIHRRNIKQKTRISREQQCRKFKCHMWLLSLIKRVFTQKSGKKRTKMQQQKLADGSQCSGPYCTDNRRMEWRSEEGELVKKKGMLLNLYNWKSTDLCVQRFLPLWMRNFATM